MLHDPLQDEKVVRKAYARQASFYDFTFGVVAKMGRKETTKIINQREGRVLEVGVGTGIALPDYADHLEVTGIDLSPEMLKKARERKISKGLHNIVDLVEMSADRLVFPDNHFDTVAAMYLITVVPDPEKVMEELKRVCKPGGQIILVNHFSQETGVRGWIEKKMMPLSGTIGWRPVFPIERVMGVKGLQLKEKRKLNPAGIFTLLRFEKEADAQMLDQPDSFHSLPSTPHHDQPTHIGAAM